MQLEAPFLQAVAQIQQRRRYLAGVDGQGENIAPRRGGQTRGEIPDMLRQPPHVDGKDEADPVAVRAGQFIIGAEGNQFDFAVEAAGELAGHPEGIAGAGVVVKTGGHGISP